MPEDLEISPFVAKCQAAFRRELPELLRERYGQWVAYRGDEVIAFDHDQIKLYKKCFTQGLAEEHFLVRRIIPEIPKDIDLIQYYND